MDQAKYPSLMKQPPGTLGSGQKWSMENLRDGMRYFYDLYGRYPTCDDIDEFDYLPSVRAIQRSYGGIVQLKTALGLSGPVDLSRGEARSRVAGIAINRSYEYEEEFYNFLISQIPEVMVHEQKILRPGNIQSDFFIYRNNREGIALDLFYAEKLSNLARIINIKLKRYKNIKYYTFFILVRNAAISQEQIDKLIQNRKAPLPEKIKVITENQFKKNLLSII